MKRRPMASWLALSSLLLVSIACGNGNDDGGSGEITTSQGTGGWAAAATGGATISTSGGVSSSTGGNTSGGTAPVGGEAGAPPATPAPCNTNAFAVAGTLASTAVNETVQGVMTESHNFIGLNDWRLHVLDIDGFGVASFWGANEARFPGTPKYAAEAARGVLFFPASTSLAGQVFGLGDGSTLTGYDPGFVVEALGVALIGSCPGAPVAGELINCTDDPCWNQLDGTVNGVTYAGTNGRHLALGDVGIYSFNEGVIFAYDREGQYLREWGALERGLVINDPRGPEAGAIYCVGAWERTDDPGQVRLYDLSYLGNVLTASGTGAATICVHP